MKFIYKSINSDFKDILNSKSAYILLSLINGFDISIEQNHDTIRDMTDKLYSDHCNFTKRVMNIQKRIEKQKYIDGLKRTILCLDIKNNILKYL